MMRELTHDRAQRDERGQAEERNGFINFLVRIERQLRHMSVKLKDL
jgi:hypothetical protein